MFYEGDKKNTVRRGSIYDANGNLLAASVETPSLYADPYLIAQPKIAAKKLVNIFPSLSYGRVLRSLQSQKRFVWLQRNISPDQQAQVMEIGEPGLGFRYEQKRVYPNKNELVHVVGMTDIDGRGLMGLERSFDNMLARGEDLHLTFDVRIQHALRREIEKAVTDFSAIGGVGVVMDVKTGAVLAAVSLPDFNPHVPKGSKKINALTV